MKISKVYIALLALLVYVRCNKREYPKPVISEESFFYSKLLIDGQPFDLTTGNGGYYMYCSYAIDSSNVYNLIGEYKTTNCSENCANSLRIQINDSKVSSPSSAILIDSALQVKNYNFLAGLSDIGYLVEFTGSFNKQHAKVLWNFGDGSTSLDLKTTHIFKLGTYPVQLKITGNDGCESVMTNTLSVNTNSDLNVFVGSSGSFNSVSFTAYPKGGKAPYKYLWDFGDGSQATGVNALHTFAIKGGYTVKLRVTDAEGRTANCLYNAVAGNDPSACAANIAYSNITRIPGRLSLSKVIIKFIDADGIVYTSDDAAQPNNSGLQILSVEDFAKNEKNQPVKKLSIKFNCTLYNGAKSLSLQGTDVQVGMAYKN